MIRWATWCLCGLLIASCNAGGTQVTIPALDRSGKIQLFCADIEDPTSFEFVLRGLLPLEACEEETTADGFDPNGFGAATQVQTGEVTAINFSNRFIVDTNRTIPGVTGSRVGEQPTGIQISPLVPDFTYVASFSPKTIQAYDTREILGVDDSELAEGDPPIAAERETPLDAGPTDLAMYELVDPLPKLTGNPVSGFTPGTVQARWLYAPIPDTGQIVQVRWVPDASGVGGVFGEPRYFQLDPHTCATNPPIEPTPESTSMDYHRICPASGAVVRDVKTVQTTPTCVDGPELGPRPIAVTVDYGTASFLDDFLLVADANQPVIHRFQLATTTGIVSEDPTLIPTGTPTTAIAVTPFVPASFENQQATKRYLYATSATDGSVLAIDYSPDSSELGIDGRVLPVVAGISTRANEESVESRNRVRSLFANARAIEVVTPGYELVTDEDGSLSVPTADLCQPLDGDALARAQDASNMAGVFLAISLANGTMFFLDVYDLNAPCRGGTAGSCNTITEPDAFASIRRHRRRFRTPTPTSFIEVQGTPSLVFNTAQGNLDDETGLPSNSDGPGLDFVTCPESMFNVFGTGTGPNEGLICTSSQVWSNFSQGWEATWEGLIPASEGGLGLFSDKPFPGTVTDPGTNWFQAGDVPFCGVGVLGAEVGPQGEPTVLPGADTNTGLENTEYDGDRLLITGELPPNRRDDDACEQFMDVPEEIDDFPVWFPIIRAFNDQLQIGESPNPNRYTLDQVRFCYDQFTEYQIRTNNVYTVVGTDSGFIHRTVPSQELFTMNECVLDTTRPIVCFEGTEAEPCPPGGTLDVDTVLSGRVFPDVQFVNPLVSVQIQDFSEEVAVTDATVAILNFSILNGFGVLVIDTSAGLTSLPASMVFSDTFDQLFLVDLQRGVRQIVFDPLNILQSFQ